MSPKPPQNDLEQRFTQILCAALSEQLPERLKPGMNGARSALDPRRRTDNLVRARRWIQQQESWRLNDRSQGSKQTDLIEDLCAAVGVDWTEVLSDGTNDDHASLLAQARFIYALQAAKEVVAARALVQMARVRPHGRDQDDDGMTTLCELIGRSMKAAWGRSEADLRGLIRTSAGQHAARSWRKTTNSGARVDVELDRAYRPSQVSELVAQADAMAKIAQHAFSRDDVRIAILRTLTEGGTVNEVARATGVNRSTLSRGRTRLHRALAALACHPEQGVAWALDRVVDVEAQAAPLACSDRERARVISVLLAEVRPGPTQALAFVRWAHAQASAARCAKSARVQVEDYLLQGRCSDAQTAMERLGLRVVA